jgi:hypothetical protein
LVRPEALTKQARNGLPGRARPPDEPRLGGGGTEGHPGGPRLGRSGWNRYPKAFEGDERSLQVQLPGR